MPRSSNARTNLVVGRSRFEIARLKPLYGLFPAATSLPYTLKVLLENLLRHGGEDDPQLYLLAGVDVAKPPAGEISFRPARVLLQDFTGVPAVADLAAMRDAMRALGGDPRRINPLQPVDLVIDHSVQVDRFGASSALAANVAHEYARNGERYQFLRWGQHAFDNFRVVPPGTGICHQVNLEYLAQVVVAGPDRSLYPDTVVGTDSHTTMINGLGVLGWGVGGIEAEAAMLGQPVTMVIPEVVGVQLTGALGAGVTATDLVLVVTERLRRHGVVGKFVEFCGPGLDGLPIADRATVANMAPEYGATCGFFPVDAETLRYLRMSGRTPLHVKRVEAYCRAQGLFRDAGSEAPRFTDLIEIDLTRVEPSIAGPRRPQDRLALGAAKVATRKAIAEALAARPQPLPSAPAAIEPASAPDAASDRLDHGAVVIAAITSCTNTSNPGVMVAAGLLAKAAVEHGLVVKPWVKTSLAPGSQVVADYLAAAGLTPYLDALGFQLVGFGCTTCIGNSGPLPAPVARAVEAQQLVVAAVLSGNRNFEGRINPQARLSYLMSPPLVVAFALAGRADIDLTVEPVGLDRNGAPVFLSDLWPAPELVAHTVERAVKREQFTRRYGQVFQGDANWRGLRVPAGDFYTWEQASTYVRRPPFFDGLTATPAPRGDVTGARALLWLGDSVTTDHISPAGNIARGSPAARYLEAQGVAPADFNAYGARRGNHEVMVRGTFANIRLRNGLVPGVEGGVTRHLPSGEQLSVYDAAMRYASEGVPLIVIAGSEYGSGSSRDWAAKGPKLLGIQVVLAKSFERIHRSNLVGMGILPLQFAPGDDATSLQLSGEELFDVVGLAAGVQPHQQLTVTARRSDGSTRQFTAMARVDTPVEAEYLRHGGILPYVLRHLAKA